MAFVILNPHGVRKWKGKKEGFEMELKAFARGRLPGFASPEWVAVVQELPKTSCALFLGFSRMLWPD
jgi:acyl-coenzyme A synthetase/AMP-(fatty) acid ligase